MDDIENRRVWRVYLTNGADKQKKKLNLHIQMMLDLLVKELETLGPIRKNWSHFSPLKKGKNIPVNSYHCHIKSGRPTYVVCWQVTNKVIQIIEVYYVGTHENAPY